jgi:hypothetical protein
MQTNQLERMGTAGLQGWRRTVGDALATPVARRSPLNEKQVRSTVGALFLALAVLYLLRATKQLLAERR